MKNDRTDSQSTQGHTGIGGRPIEVMRYPDRLELEVRNPQPDGACPVVQLDEEQARALALRLWTGANYIANVAGRPARASSEATIHAVQRVEEALIAICDVLTLTDGEQRGLRATAIADKLRDGDTERPPVRAVQRGGLECLCWRRRASAPGCPMHTDKGALAVAGFVLDLRPGDSVVAAMQITYTSDGVDVPEGARGTVFEVTHGGALASVRWDGQRAARATSTDCLERPLPCCGEFGTGSGEHGEDCGATNGGDA